MFSSEENICYSDRCFPRVLSITHRVYFQILVDNDWLMCYSFNQQIFQMFYILWNISHNNVITRCLVLLCPYQARNSCKKGNRELLATRWLAQLPHSNKIPGSYCDEELAWVFSQSKNMHVKLTGDFKLPIGLNVCVCKRHHWSQGE